MTDPIPEDLSFLVFDTSPLTHMAKAQLLGMLKLLSGSRTAILTDVVELEIRQGVLQIPELQAILEVDWLQRRTLASKVELHWFQTFAQRLIGRDGRNRGETSVLAWVKANGDAEAVIDDAEARRLAVEFDIPHRGTLRFLVDAVKDGHLSRQLASDLADEFLASGARSPFGPGGFIIWAEQQGLLG